MDPIPPVSEPSIQPGTSPNARPPSRSDRSALNRSLARSYSRGWQPPASEVWRSRCTGLGTRSAGLRKRRARRSRRTMGRNPTRMVLPILIGISLLGAAWPVVSPVAATSVKGEDNRTPAVAGGGTHEIVADPIRPFIYQVGWGDGVAYLNASTGAYIDSVIVGPSATSIDRSADGNFLYVAVSGANQTVVVDIDARRVVRTINLGFSPFSVRHGGPDRLFVSSKDNGSVQIVNETTGSGITTWSPLGAYQSSLESLLAVSPNGSELFVHL